MREDYVKRGLQAPKRAKVGHAGTLDPFATGLLICLLGKGTRRAAEFLKKDKRYEATICLGKVSTTGHPEGKIGSILTGVTGPASSLPHGSSTEAEASVLAPGDPATVTPDSPLLITDFPTLEQVQSVVSHFQGKITQRVPAYSAVKINGRRAYDLARKGIEVEMPVRKVRIYELELVSYEWPELKIRCKVSSGTYIRALGEDIGAALGVGGYLTELRRTEIGEFSVKDAVALDEIMRG